MRVGLYNGIYFGIQFTEIDKFCCYKKKVLISSSFIVASTSPSVLEYWQGSTGNDKGTVNQNLLFIATKLINFCKLNTKINSII
jgi:hypothetical protein